jgi:hypothetical protein
MHRQVALPSWTARTLVFVRYDPACLGNPVTRTRSIHVAGAVCAIILSNAYSHQLHATVKCAHCSVTLAVSHTVPLSCSCLGGACYATCHERPWRMLLDSGTEVLQAAQA